MKNLHNINWRGIWTIYKQEMRRTKTVFIQSIFSPVITTALYFVVFGAALGGSVKDLNGVTYMQYIVPGLIMMALLTNSFSAASSSIFFPKFMGTIYELLTAPLSYVEITLGYVLSAVTRSLIIGTIIFTVALFFTPITILHPWWTIFFSIITSFIFALFGFIIGLWASSFEKLQTIPVFIITPMSFLGGVFYSLSNLPPFWQKITLFNPMVYMIDSLRWSFFGIADINPTYSLLFIGVLTAIFFILISIIFRTGYNLRR